MGEKKLEILRVENLSRRFEETLAVNDVSLAANTGDLLAVVGPSGCGKTTLLRMIAGLERPDSGRIWLDGRQLSDANTMLYVPPNQRRIGMVFQNYALWPHMNVFQNVAYPLRMSGVDKKEQRQSVKTALEQVRMSGYEKRLVHEMSGGEQQRIALARALVMQPRILLLDEPLSNLDAHLREDMGNEIKRIQRESELTVIYVTHDQVEAMTLSDRIVVMNHGRVMQIGAPQIIYREPQNCFVAGFMGVSNLLRCKIVGSNGSTAALMPDGERLTLNSLHGLSAGADVTLSIRPEDISICEQGEGSRAKVQEVRYQGNLVHYRLSCEGAELRVQALPEQHFAVGDVVRVCVRHATLVPERKQESH